MKNLLFVLNGFLIRCFEMKLTPLVKFAQGVVYKMSQNVRFERMSTNNILLTLPLFILLANLKILSLALIDKNGCVSMGR